MKRMIMWAIGLLVMVSAANAQLKKETSSWVETSA